MKKRAQKLSELFRTHFTNIEYFGLSKGQIVHVKTTDYEGLARIMGDPPQGPGIYVYTTNHRSLLVGGENIAEATEPS